MLLNRETIFESKESQWVEDYRDVFTKESESCSVTQDKVEKQVPFHLRTLSISRRLLRWGTDFEKYGAQIVNNMTEKLWRERESFYGTENK